MEESNLIRLPIYQRLLGFLSVAPEVLWRLLEADLRYRLEYEPQRKKALAAEPPYLRRHSNGIESLLVEIGTYCARALSGYGLSDLEDSEAIADLAVFHRYLEDRLRTSKLDFYDRDTEAPENTMVILTNEERKPAIGVRLPRSRDRVLHNDPKASRLIERC